MSTYTIGQVAERTGFAASALRYYEGIGLVTPAARTDRGYRIYDDHTVERLSFIDRAKQLGCSLEEITELVALWDGDRCGPVQRRLHDLVTAKIADAEAQVRELTALRAQLQAAAGQLAGPATDGPCDEGCACLMSPCPTTDDLPIACTLDPDAIGDRLADWKVALRHATSRSVAADGTLRLKFSAEVRLAELAELIAAEQGCCAFFSFALTVDRRGIGLEVAAPEGAEAMLSALFGDAA